MQFFSVQVNIIIQGWVLYWKFILCLVHTLQLLTASAWRTSWWGTSSTFGTRWPTENSERCWGNRRSWDPCPSWIQKVNFFSSLFPGPEFASISNHSSPMCIIFPSTCYISCSNYIDNVYLALTIEDKWKWCTFICADVASRTARRTLLLLYRCSRKVS